MHAVTEANLRCEQRVEARLKDRLDDLRAMWNAEQNGTVPPKECGNLHEYGLCFDWVPPFTFDEQRAGYVRYQLSWGEPCDEFRFFVDEEGNVHEIEYWFLDWGDGAHREIEGNDFDFMVEIYDWLGGLESARK